MTPIEHNDKVISLWRQTGKTMNRISLLAALSLSGTVALAHEPMESLILAAEIAALEESTNNYMKHDTDSTNGLMRLVLVNQLHIAAHLCLHHEVEEFCANAEMAKRGMDCFEERGMVEECRAIFE